MPPNPNVNPEYLHQLSADQKTAVETATTAGRLPPEEPRNLALRNILQQYEDPNEALQYLANQRTMPVTGLEAEWTDLQANPARVPGSPEQARFEQIERQIKGNLQLEASVQTAYQRQHAEDLISYQTMELPELAGIVNNLRGREATARAARDAARRTAGAGYATNTNYINANKAAQTARTRVQEAENVFNQRDQPNREAQAAQREQQRQQEEARMQAQRTQLEGMDVRGLRAETTRLGTQITELTARRKTRAAAGAGAEELAAIDRDLSRAQERNTEAGKILGEKLVNATEDINTDPAMAAEKDFVERATNAEILAQIQDRQSAANDLRSDIQDFRDELDNPVTTPARRLELQNLLYDATQRLRREEGVLRVYQGEISKSNKDYRAMTPEQRAAELTKLANEIDVTLFAIGDINDRLNRGENVTKEEMAAWTKSTIQNLVEKGRAGVNMAQLNRILATRPEFRLALAKGFENSEEARKLIGEKLPTNWQKMWRFASKHQGWLMILLALLAGATAGAAVLAGPLAGAAVAGGGLGTGGAGAVTYGRRR